MATTTLPAGCCNPFGMFKTGPLPRKVFAIPKLSFGAKLLYTLVVYHCWKHDCAWPKITTLAQELGTSSRNISRLLKELQVIGAITVESRQALGAPNKYYTNADFVLKYNDIEDFQDADAIQTPEEGVGRIRHEGKTNPSWGYDESVMGGRTNPSSLERESETEKKQKRSRQSAEADASASAHRSFENLSGEEEGISLPISNSALSQQQQLSLLTDTPLQHPNQWNWMGATMPLDEAKHNLETQLRLQKLQVAKGEGEGKYAAEVQRRQDKEKRRSVCDGKPLTVRLAKPIGRLEQLWVKCCAEKFPGVPMPQAWSYKEHKPIKELFNNYKYTEEAIANAIEYFIRYWDKHRTRFSKTPSSFPTVSLFRAVHERVLPEAQVMSKALKVKAEYEAWCAQHRGEMTLPPQDLQKAYAAAKQELQTVGL